MTTKAQLLKTIRMNCIDCIGSQTEVQNCTATGEGNTKKCLFYDFRMGKDPRKNPRKVAQGRANPNFKRKPKDAGPTHADDDLERQDDSLEHELEPEDGS